MVKQLRRLGSRSERWAIAKSARAAHRALTATRNRARPMVEKADAALRDLDERYSRRGSAELYEFVPIKMTPARRAALDAAAARRSAAV